MFVYTLAGQGVLTNIGTTELDEECSGAALIYLIEHMLARSFPPHDNLCQLGNLDVLMLIESRLSNDESAPGCTTRVLNLHAPHAQLEWLVPFMPISWRTSLPLLSNTEHDHSQAHNGLGPKLWARSWLAAPAGDKICRLRSPGTSHWDITEYNAVS